VTVKVSGAVLGVVTSAQPMMGKTHNAKTHTNLETKRIAKAPLTGTIPDL